MPANSNPFKSSGKWAGLAANKIHIEGDSPLDMWVPGCERL